MLITNEKTNSDYSHCYPTIPIMDRVGVEFNSELILNDLKNLNEKTMRALWSPYQRRD